MKWRAISGATGQARGKSRVDRRCSPADAEDATNPGGLPIEAFDQIRAGVLADRSQFFKDLSMPFYGYNRPGAKVSEGVRESFWLQGMMAGIPLPISASRHFRKPIRRRT